MRKLHEAGEKCLCYNFIPVIDWDRSDLAFVLKDGSQVMSYMHDEVVKRNPDFMSKAMAGKPEATHFPGMKPKLVLYSS